MKIARSGIGWLIAEYGTLALSLVASMYFTRALPNADATLGLFAGFNTAVSLVTVVVASGLGQALTKRISEGENRGAYLTTAVGAVLVFAAVASVFVVLASPFAVARFDVEYAVIAFLVVMIFAKPLRNIFQSGLRGVSMVGTSGGLSFVEMFVRVVVQVVLVYVGMELLGLVVGATVGMVVSAVVSMYLLPVGFERPTRDQARSLFEFSKYSFFKGLAGRFYDNIDIIVIIWLLGKELTGQYSITFRLGLALAIFSGSISNVTFPEISRNATEENFERIEEILTDGLVFSTLLAVPATVGLAILAEPIVTIFFTEQFAGAAIISVVAVAIQIPDGLRSVFTSGIDGLDRPDLTLHADLILISVNLVLDLLLVPTIGILGAAIASLVGVTAASAYLGYTMFTQFDLPPSAFPIVPLLAETVAALAMGGVIYWLRDALSLSMMLEVAVLVPAGVVVYFAVLLVISSSIRVRLLGIAEDVVPF